MKCRIERLDWSINQSGIINIVDKSGGHFLIKPYRPNPGRREKN